MALYYNLVFGLLVFEMTFFTVLSMPYPRKIRRSILATVLTPFRNEQFQIAVKCILGFILVLFIDSVNRVFSVESELRAITPGNNTMAGVVNDRAEIQARRFYAQRNMYLCGFTLFLTLTITRVYSLVAELIDTKDRLDAAKTSSDNAAATEKDSDEIAKLKEELASKDQDLDILKEQAKSLSKDYELVTTEATKRA